MNWEIGEEILITHPILARDSTQGAGRPAIVTHIESYTTKYGKEVRLSTKGITSPTAVPIVFNEVWCKKMPTLEDNQLEKAILYWREFFGVK